LQLRRLNFFYNKPGLRYQPKDRSMALVFISHATPDKPFVVQLAQQIEALGHHIWLDEWVIRVGDHIPRKIAEGLDKADYLVVVLSRHSTASQWVEREWELMYWQEIRADRRTILPLLLEDCLVPILLRAKKCADFRSSFDAGFTQLVLSLNHGECDNRGRRSLSPQDTLTSKLVPSLVYSSDPVTMPKLTSTQIALEIPYLGSISGIWEPDDHERQAAWEMYIELVTRIPLGNDGSQEGLFREALTSLHSLFPTTRTILKKYGPSVAIPKKGNHLSFGYIAVAVLNLIIRPVLTKWHPLLLDYEHQRPASISQAVHEQRWDEAEELRSDLRRARDLLVDYTNVLAKIIKLPPIA
jgi:hypothetical protein